MNYYQGEKNNELVEWQENVFINLKDTRVFMLIRMIPVRKPMIAERGLHARNPVLTN